MDTPRKGRGRRLAAEAADDIIAAIQDALSTTPSVAADVLDAVFASIRNRLDSLADELRQS